MNQRYIVKPIGKTGQWGIWDSQKAGQWVSEEYSREDKPILVDACSQMNIRDTLPPQPMAWLQHALWLKMAAQLHWKMRCDLINREIATDDHRNQAMSAFLAYLMLIGYSLECLIKGAHIAQTPHLSFDERFNQWRNCGSGHKLTGLIELFDPPIVLEKNEIELMKRAQEYSLWAGRYPGPSSSETHISHSSSPNDPQIVEKIFERFSEIITTYKDPHAYN